MPATVADRRDNGIKVLRKAVGLLESFTPERPSMPLGSLVKATGLNPATTRRILLTLEDLKLIAQDPVTREYSLGLRLFELGSRVTHRLSLSKSAIPVMTDLTATSGESTYLGIYDAGEVVYTEIVESQQPLRLVVRVGERLPSHCTGNGKVLLANLPPAELMAELQRPRAQFTPATPYRVEELLPQLEAALRDGYAITADEHLEGISSVAAPVWDRTGQVIAALSLCGPSSRLTPERLHGLAPGLVAAADRITRAMGGRSHNTRHEEAQ